MAWVVDTCVLIDVAEADPTFGVASAKLLDLKRSEGLTVCPVTYVELAPVFNGDQVAQEEFLFNLGVNWPEAWTQSDTEEAHRSPRAATGSSRATKAILERCFRAWSLLLRNRVRTRGFLSCLRLDVLAT